MNPTSTAPSIALAAQRRPLAVPRIVSALLLAVAGSVAAQNANPTVTLDVATRDRLGIETAALEARALEPESTSMARVLDPAPLAALAAEIAALEATLPASRAEAERTAHLFEEDQNVSARVRDEAAARFATDEARLFALRQRLSLEWGPWLARLDRAGRSRLLDAVAAGRIALVRVELDAARSSSDAPLRLTLAPIDAPERTVTGKPLGALPAVDPQFQSSGWLFRVETSPGELPVGRVLLARLPTGAAAETGVFLPSSALVRREGALWAYVATGETTFERRAVVGAHPVAGGWFAPRGFTAGERVVTVGAADLIAAEQSTGPEPAAEEDND